MYQPEIKEEHVRNLYLLKVATKKPMTKLINAILGAFFKQLEEFKEKGPEGFIENGATQVRIGNIQLSFLNQDADQCAGKQCKAKSKGIVPRVTGNRGMRCREANEIPSDNQCECGVCDGI